MSDIVKKLRLAAGHQNGDLVIEAANEIERLREIISAYRENESQAELLGSIIESYAVEPNEILVSLPFKDGRVPIVHKIKTELPVVKWGSEQTSNASSNGRVTEDGDEAD